MVLLLLQPPRGLDLKSYYAVHVSLLNKCILTICNKLSCKDSMPNIKSGVKVSRSYKLKKFGLLFHTVYSTIFHSPYHYQ